MKILLILFVTLAATFVQAEDQKLVGTFEMVPMDVLMGLPRPVTEKEKKLMDGMKERLVITDKDMRLAMAAGAGIYLTYTIQGDFILGKTVIGTTEMYYPIYVKDADTLFMMGQKFIRVKEEKK
jgi:hypothetical protein